MTDSGLGGRLPLTLLLSLLLCTLAAPGAAHAAGRTGAHQRVPFGFVGTTMDGPIAPGAANPAQISAQLDLMVASGVESLRVSFYWSAAQPYRRWSDVPAGETGRFQSNGVDDVPTDFGALDSLVAQAARHHLRLLPVIINAPGWDGEQHPGGLVAIPRRAGPYAAFCQALAHRYGARGTFWNGGLPTVPITSWQIWNEPNVPAFWPVSPFAPRYVALLRAARGAIKHADAHARIVLASLANYSWNSLRSIYRVRGARGLFDVVGLHPYTRTPQNVLRVLALARGIMRGAGDGGKPMIADEISWPSSRGHTNHNTGYDFVTTEAGQARDVDQAIKLLAAARVRLGLSAFYYYTWASRERHNGLAFDFAGLLKYVGGRFVRKPAFYAFRRGALGAERCRVKAAVATACRASF